MCVLCVLCHNTVLCVPCLSVVPGCGGAACPSAFYCAASVDSGVDDVCIPLPRNAGQPGGPCMPNNLQVRGHCGLVCEQRSVLCTKLGAAAGDNVLRAVVIAQSTSDEEGSAIPVRTVILEDPMLRCR
jgi:hypothetical protein